MLFGKPALPKSIQHWYASPQAAIQLRELLDNPIFLTACATLSAAAQPAHMATHALSPEKQAASFAWLAGYHDFLRDLEKLTRMPSEGPLATPEWDHITKTP
jgi:hypothetical protein